MRRVLLTALTLALGAAGSGSVDEAGSFECRAPW
jgi:hypothetical protein